MKERSHFHIPTRIQLPREILGIFDAAKLLFKLNKLRTIMPRGNGETVVVLPGYATDDLITTPLRSYISSLGYNSLGWGLGTNHGNVPYLLEKLTVMMRKIHSETGSKIKLIGWSLGGYLARETARDNQDIIEKVITIGAPLIGGPKYTSISNVFAQQFGIDINELEKEIDERYKVPLEIPVYSIYSKSDNIVGWNACIDNLSPNAINQEIRSTHIGLIANYESYKFIGQFLA
ncbi:esterase/lipase family protein [Leptospira sp. GIMC2001]|uniref:esterase/lipase family protein n=1 Tax=Leptospira sp. GIMC2001 TaxID=1513297 RepID=UPI00234A3E4D|nr:alpha/beta hydrolase [Leptospira sp. GIMC2001]WCL49391.1 alpha/beta hydrolase [Leptospira sp. GIMC2001]